MSQFDLEYVNAIRSALKTLIDEVSEYLHAQGDPQLGSLAVTERDSYPRSQSIISACGIGNQLIELGGDHVSAFTKIITVPIETMATWTCVRSMLESCALSAWLFDPTIDAHKRVSRQFALRFEGLEQQLKFGRVVGVSAKEIAAAEQRIIDVEQDAISCGFTPLRDKKNRIAGIAEHMPGATEIIALMLDEEKTYRLLSAVAHGHTWAIIRLGFTPGTASTLGDVKVTAYEKTINFRGIALLGLCAAKAMAHPLLNQCRYYGWDLERLKGLLERMADRLRYTDSPRFWRNI